MKKVFFVVALLCTCSVFAQKKITQVAEVNQYAPSFQVWKGEGQNRYVNFRRPSSYYSTDCLVAIPEDGSDAKVYKCTRPDDYNWKQMACFEGSEEFFFLYKFNDYKNNRYVFYRNILLKDDEKHEWKPEQLFSLPKIDDVSFSERTVVSPDYRKASLLLLATSGKKNNLRGSMAMLFDETGLSWRTDVNMDFSETNLQILDMAMGNDGMIYVAILSYENDGKGVRSETLHFCEIGPDGFAEVASNVDFGHVTGAKMIVRRDGTVAVGGYYAADMQKKEGGSFMAVYDNVRIVNFSHQDFPSEYYAYTFPGNGAKAEFFSVYPMEFFEFSNGTLAFLGDMQSFSMYETFSGNIIVNFVDENGDFAGFKMVDKNQLYMGNQSSPKGLRQSLLSYYALFEDDSIHIFFSDNPKNYSGSSRQVCNIQTTFFTSKLKFKPHCAVHCVIGADKQITPPALLMKYADVGTYLKEPLFVFGKELYFYHFQDKYFRISKMEL